MQVILGLGSGNLVYLEVGPGSIQQAGHLQLQAELACLDITPLGEDPDRAQIAVAGEAVKYCGGQCFVARSRPLLPCHSPVRSKRRALACSAVQECLSAVSRLIVCHRVQHVHVMLLPLSMSCAVARPALSCHVVPPPNKSMSAMLPLVTLACPAGSWSQSASS